MLKVQALNRHQIFSLEIVVLQYDVAERCNLELQTRNIYYRVIYLFTQNSFSIYKFFSKYNLLYPELSQVNIVHSWQVVALHLMVI